MKRLLLVALLSVLTPLLAQETVTLTTPEAISGPSITQYRIKSFSQEYDDPATATVVVNGQNTGDEGRIVLILAGLERAVQVTCVYDQNTTPTATFLETALNKANLSTAYAGNATTGSFKQRVNHRLVVLGEAATVCGRSLVGTLTGTVP